MSVAVLICRLVIALLLLASAMALTLYLGEFPQAPLALDFLMGIFFPRDPQGVTVQAPPFLNISRAKVVVSWAFLNGLGALALLVHKRKGDASDRENQARAAEFVVCLLTLVCLTMLVTRLAKILYYDVVA